jgi:hypothetical protein
MVSETIGHYQGSPPTLFCRYQRQKKETRKMESMLYSSTILLMPHNYLEWCTKNILLLRSRSLYQITMEMEVDHNSIDEKNDFLNRQDMAMGYICMFVSPKCFHQVYDESQESSPKKLWNILEALFWNKEKFMQKFDKIKPVENPLDDQSFQLEEPST